VVPLLAVLAAMSGAARAATPVLPTNDPFYSWSGSLTGVEPGTVLRSRQVTLADAVSVPLSATQVLYRTSGELGQPTVTVATIIRPVASVSTKILSWQTFYDALGSECDPSYVLQGGNPSYDEGEIEASLMIAYAEQGYTVVTADYEGESLDYGAGLESGYGTLDAIKAAESYLKLSPATTKVGLIGYSGGAIATEWASELAAKYAPGLDIVGFAEGGIPVDYAHNLNYINGSSSWSGVIPAVSLGVARAFHLDLTPYLSAYGQQVINQVSDQCINNFLGAYPGLTIQKLLKPQYADWEKVPVFVNLYNKMIMGTAGTPNAPVFMANGDADGTGDGVMIAKDVQELAHEYCGRGVSVELNIYDGDDHDEAAVPFEEHAIAFLTDRFNGISVPDQCSSIGPGNSLAPLPEPPAGVRSRLRYLYAGSSARALRVRLSSTRGVLRGIVVTVRSAGRVVDRVWVRSVSQRGLLVLLRVRHLRRGRYTVTVTEGRTVLLRRIIRVR
jgi:hypothetical protein